MESEMKYSTNAVAFSNQGVAKNCLLARLGGKKNEVFCGLFYGITNQAQVYPRVIAQKCLEYNAAAIILAHNHPSGCLLVSEGDKLITTKLINTLDLLDIRVLDHL